MPYVRYIIARPIPGNDGANDKSSNEIEVYYSEEISYMMDNDILITNNYDNEITNGTHITRLQEVQINKYALMSGNMRGEGGDITTPPPQGNT